MSDELLPAPEKVDLYASPWVSGTRADAYYGPISVERYFPNSLGRGSELDDLISASEEELRALARALGANSVIGVEVTFDPFFDFPPLHPGMPVGRALRIHLVGTAARLVPAY